jgi:hypothetical protein
VTAAREAEAEQVSTTYHAALTRLGVATVEEALSVWHRLPPQHTPGMAAAWLRLAVRMVMTRRGRARELAMAYYRLARALRTGRTIADPRRPEPQYVTLGQLRREFTALASPAETPASSGEPVPAPPRGGPSDQQDPVADDSAEPDEPSAEDDEADRILVEQIAELDREQQRQEREAEREAQLVLDQLGPRLVDRKTRDLDPDAPARDVDAARKQAHAQAGARQAAAAQRLVMNGGRSTVWTNTQHDRRALGYIRVSPTGTPCGWCAMLLSRGAVYKSSATAEYSDGDKYHDHCRCTAEPVYTATQTASSKYALNREYGELWPQVTKGLSGKAAVAAWRRFIREQQATAQEAKATSAREATP